MTHLQQHLAALGACRKGLEWARTQRNILDAWWACRRGDWLLWLAAKLGVKQRTMVFAACEVARLALPFYDDDRLRTAIILAEQWADGHDHVDLDELLVAAEDCRQAALDAGCHARFDAANAAYAARFAVLTATLNSKPKEAAAAAAESVAEAAADAATSHKEGDKARIAMQEASARVVRGRIDDLVILSAWNRHFRAQS